MAHQPTEIEDRIVLEDGKITRIVKAIYDKPGKSYSEIDVYKENEDGECWSQNLYQSVWGSNVVMFPGHPRCMSYWYHDESIAEPEGWIQRDRRSLFGWSRTQLTQEEKGLIIMYHYDFKYVMKKYNFKSLRDVMDKLIMWKQYPEVEMVLASGFEKLAMNKQFYRMKPENKKKIVNFCREYPEACDLKYKEIQQCIKAENTALMVKYLMCVSNWMQKDITIEDFKYLVRKNNASTEGVHLYADYQRLLRMSEHDQNQEYWKYPKNLQKQHDKILHEIQIAEELKRQAEAEKKKKALAEKMGNFKKICKKYSKYNATIDGYSIYFSDDFEDWEKQAKQLNQCIIYADYISMVADKKCLIAFIRRDNIPIATAEIKPGKILGQFYADEHDRNNCKPSDEVKAVFNKWFSKLEVKDVI